MSDDVHTLIEGGPVKFVDSTAMSYGSLVGVEVVIVDGLVDWHRKTAQMAPFKDVADVRITFEGKTVDKTFDQLRAWMAQS